MNYFVCILHLKSVVVGNCEWLALLKQAMRTNVRCGQINVFDENTV